MKAEDTVMAEIEMERRRTFGLHQPIPMLHVEAIAKAQAEISFKAGIREVVEAVEKFGALYKGNPWWDKKLKEWGS